MDVEDILRKKWKENGFEMDESNEAWRITIEVINECTESLQKENDRLNKIIKRKDCSLGPR